MSVTFILAAVYLFLGGIAGAVLFGYLAQVFAFTGPEWAAPAFMILTVLSLIALLLGAGDQVSFWLGIGAK